LLFQLFDDLYIFLGSNSQSPRLQPRKILTKEALMDPHRTYLVPENTEHEIEILRKATKEMLEKERLSDVEAVQRQLNF